jgi:hypothetical protein
VWCEGNVIAICIARKKETASTSEAVIKHKYLVDVTLTSFGFVPVTYATECLNGAWGNFSRGRLENRTLPFTGETGAATRAGPAAVLESKLGAGSSNSGFSEDPLDPVFVE